MAPQVISGHSLICGQTVSVVSKSGELTPIHFAGFIKANSPSEVYCPVKLRNIEAFSTTIGFGSDWICYGLDAVMLGSYQHPDGVYLVLVEGMPVAWCEMPKPKSKLTRKTYSRTIKKPQLKTSGAEIVHAN